MPNQYRIVTNGGRFRIQRKHHTAEEWEMYGHPHLRDFQSISAAKSMVAYLRVADERADEPWVPVKEDDE